MKKKVALFDFDGTITREDSLLAFIRFTRGPLIFVAGWICLSPVLFAMKAKLISNHKAKEYALRFFFGGTTAEKFAEWCHNFAKSYLPRIIRPGAIEKILALQNDGNEVVIVSASPENWLIHWTNQHGLSLIGTRLELKNNRITGLIDGKNCHGTEKVTRILKNYPAETTEITAAFGDTKGDLPMLNLALVSYWKPFRK